MPHPADAAVASSITTPAPIHDTRGPVSTAAPNLWERIAIACRVKHYSLSTERAYVAWARRFVAWSGRRHPCTMGASEVEAYLTHLAIDQGVSASTQNQALSALLFLYRAVLGADLPWLDNLVRARPSQHLPAVLSHGAITRAIPGTRVA